MCFDLTVPDDLPPVPSMAAIRVLDEPGLDWELTRSLIITLTGGTVLMDTNIMELVGTSAVNCCMV